MTAAGRRASSSVDRHRVRDDLAVDAGLADAPGDQLGVLRPEVDDEDGGSSKAHASSGGPPEPEPALASQALGAVAVIPSATTSAFWKSFRLS